MNNIKEQIIEVKYIDKATGDSGIFCGIMFVMENENFNKALSRFVKDFAYKDEVIAKYKRGLSISDINKELLFKVSEEEIAKIIDDSKVDDDFVKVFDKYGKGTFIKK